MDRQGRRVDPSQLQPLLSKLPVRQFRLEQRVHGEIALIVHGASGPLGAATLDQTVAALSRLLSEPTRLAIVQRPQPIVRAGEKPVVYRSLLS